MLIKNRKFDIRIWVLVDHFMNIYYFKEWYLRLSSEEYNTSPEGIDDVYIHLTNIAI